MSKFHFSILAILFLVLVGLGVIEKVYHQSLPKIELPQRAHNTIGEIPLIEHYDDGKLEKVNPRNDGWKRPCGVTDCFDGGVAFVTLVSGGSWSYI